MEHNDKIQLLVTDQTKLFVMSIILNIHEHFPKTRAVKKAITFSKGCFKNYTNSKFKKKQFPFPQKK